MSYKVTAPLVIIPNADGTSSDWYGYDGAPVPEGLNDERCKQLVKEGMLEKVKDTAKADPKADPDGDTKPTRVEGILEAVGSDKEKAAAALAEEKAGKNRKTLVGPLEALLADD